MRNKYCFSTVKMVTGIHLNITLYVQSIINPLNARLNPICPLPVILGDLRFMGPCIVSIFQYISNVTQFIYIWKLLYMFRVVLPPIIRSAYNCIYSIWYLSRRYCYPPLSWKSWNRFACAVGGVLHPQHTQTGSNSSTFHKTRGIS